MCIRDSGNPEWEKLSIFLNMLIPKLPSPQEDDFAQGILEAIDLDSYRIEKRETISLILPDEDKMCIRDRPCRRRCFTTQASAPISGC